MKEIDYELLPYIIQLINNILRKREFEFVEVNDALDKLSFTLPKGLKSKEIEKNGKFPVISQSIEQIIGYSDKKEFLITNDLPIIIFGDHSKTIKYVDHPFILGADGVKLLKPIRDLYDEKFFYYFLFGVVTDTKSYGRHYSLLRKGLIPKIEISLQKELVLILEDNRYISKNSLIKEISKEINILIDTNSLSNQMSNEIIFQLKTIKDLRQALLLEAVTGKLGSNENSGNKTGINLLRQIEFEKDNLIKAKKIKKDKIADPIDENEIPFEQTEKLCFIRLGEIAVIEKGKVGIQKAVSGKYELVVTGEKRLSSNEYHFEGSSVIVPLVSSTGHGHASLKRIHYQEGKYAVGNILAVIQTFFPTFFNMKFIFHYLDSFKEQFFVEKMKGGANVSLKISSILETPIPVIPKDVQDKYEYFVDFYDKLESSIKENQKYNEQLLQQVLREALEEKELSEDGKLALVAEESLRYPIHNNISKNCDIGDMAILSGYIIKKLSTENTKDFGRVKLQKMLHLTEYHCQLSTELNYQKNVAGPYSEDLEKKVEPKLKSYRFFDIKKEKLGNNSKVTYTPLSASSQLASMFNKEFQDQADGINLLLEKFQNKTWEFCEMISTMYAVWNNRLIKKEDFTNEILKQDFLSWDESKKRFINDLDYAIEWIKKEKIEPIGFGEYIDKK